MNPSIVREAGWETSAVCCPCTSSSMDGCPDYVWHTCVPRARHCADWTGRRTIWSLATSRWSAACLGGARAEVASDVASERQLAHSPATAAGQPASLAAVKGPEPLQARPDAAAGRGAYGRVPGQATWVAHAPLLEACTAAGEAWRGVAGHAGGGPCPFPAFKPCWSAPDQACKVFNPWTFTARCLFCFQTAIPRSFYYSASAKVRGSYTCASSRALYEGFVCSGARCNIVSRGS